MTENTPAVVILNKPVNWTSSDIVVKLKKTMGYKKVGHGGTLDPFATGLLPIFIGPYTKLASLFHDADKRYSATLSLGKKTDTADHTGKVIKEIKVRPLTQMQCKLVERALIGRVKLSIPIYSAKKVQGTPLYKLAREQKITSSQRYQVIHIHELSIKLIDSSTITFTAKVSSGTYIRALGELIAHKLSTVGHLSSLDRQAYYLPSGKVIDSSISLENYLTSHHDHAYYADDLEQLIPTIGLRRNLYRPFALGGVRHIPLAQNGWHLIVKQDKTPLGLVSIDKTRIINRIFLT